MPKQSRGAVTEAPCQSPACAAAQGLCGGPAPAALSPFYQTPGPPRGAAAFCARTPARIMRQKIFRPPLDNVYIWGYIVYIVYIRI
ncbi:MAG: hypothetical protein DBY17_05700 [Oscillospiraceae bacterium]|nr:MAG: hypothetical protein DBY17_05700 [Oscillospiraceae bacterium]